MYTYEVFKFRMNNQDENTSIHKEDLYILLLI